jgi:hypothetical protein
MDLSWVLVISKELSIDGSFFMGFNWIFLWEVVGFFGWVVVFLFLMEINFYKSLLFSMCYFISIEKLYFL